MVFPFVLLIAISGAKSPMLVPIRKSAELCVIALDPLSSPAGVVEFKESHAADAINAAPIVVFKIMQQFTTSIDPLDVSAQGL